MVVLAVIAVPGRAATINVPADYSSISDAVNAASDGDTVLVADGTYSGPGIYTSANITIKSVNGPGSTILDYTGCYQGMLLQGSETVQGFTIENANIFDAVITAYGSATIDNCVFSNNSCFEGGAFSGWGDSPTISNCTFTNNSCETGIFLDFANATISNCTFTGNNSTLGGGIDGYISSGTVTGCKFTGNTASGNAGEYGGAVVWGNGSLTLTQCAFDGNSAPQGGAVFVIGQGSDTSVTANQCLFKNNSAAQGGAIYITSNDPNAVTVNINDCVFLNNQATDSGNSPGDDGAAIFTGALNAAASCNITNSSFFGNNVPAGIAGAGTIAGAPQLTLMVLNSILYGDLSSSEFSSLNTPGAFNAANNDIHQAGFAGVNNNIDADPLYTNAANGDLHLQNASPCIGAAATAGAPSTDYSDYVWGNAVTMGAYSPVHFILNTPGSATTGTAFTFSVTALAADNSTVVNNYSGTVHFSGTDNTAALPADSMLINGIGAFNATLNTAGSQTISAVDSQTVAIAGTSPVINAGRAAAQFAVSLPAATTAGTPFTFTVTAKDSLGNTAAGYSGTVHFTCDDPTATLPADATLINGIGTFQATATRATTVTIRARDITTSSITGTASTNVAATAVTHFTLTIPAGTQTTIAFMAIVMAKDQFENVVKNYSGTVHFTSSNGTAVLPANSMLTSGAKQFSIKLQTPGSQTLTVTDTTNSALTTTASTTVSAIASKLLITAPANATAGSPFTFTVTAIDSVGNTATGYAGTVHFTCTDGAAALPVDIALTNGTGTFQATLKTAGARSLTATDTIVSTIKGASGAITVAAGAAASFTVTAPATATAGSAFTYTVTARDSYGNIATGCTDTIHLGSTDPHAVLPANAPLVKGVKSFLVKLATAGNQTITATDLSAPISATSGSIAVH